MQTHSYWMQGRQRRISQHVFLGLQTNLTALSFLRVKTKIILTWKSQIFPSYFVQYFEWTCIRLMCLTPWAKRLTWSWPPSVDFLVQVLRKCFDMLLSNISAAWPAASHRQQGYNPSVEPSLSHRVLIQCDGCRELGVYCYGCSLESVLGGVLVWS